MSTARFRSRVQLTAVPGIGPKTFEQAAGFLRIRDGDNPLDITAVHPESYPVVEQIAQTLNTPVEELIQQPALLEKVDEKQTLRRRLHAERHSRRAAEARTRPARDNSSRPAFRDSEGDRRPATGHDARRRRHQRDQVRRLRRHRRASGRTGSHQRTIQPLHQGAIAMW